jgi:TrpR-related protein YerC/YecD
MKTTHSDAPLETYSPSIETKALFKAVGTLKNEKEIAAFLRDLLTPAEIEEFTNRWQAVLMLEKGIPYLEISQKLGISTTTVTRCNQWLRRGAGGYKTALSRTTSKR